LDGNAVWELPLRTSGLRHRTPKNFHQVAARDVAWLEDPHVDTSQIPVAQRGHRYKPKRVGTETCTEFVATVMRLGRNSQDSSAHSHHRAHRQVCSGEIKLEKEVIAEQRKWLAVGDQLGYVQLHHGDLPVRVAILSSSPSISWHALLKIEENALE
jgi:hypothetical protein